MADSFKTVAGRISLLGNSITTWQAKGYSVIELVDENNYIITLKNIAVSLDLDNYLSLGNSVELKIVNLPAVVPFFSKPSSYIYGVKLPNRNLIGFVPKLVYKRMWILAIFLCFSPVFPLGLYLLYRSVVVMNIKRRMKKDIE